MADFGMLFTLTLVALAFVVVGVCFIVYIMIIGERAKRKQAESHLLPDEQLKRDCPHHFGYLSGYPSDHLVPEECYNCAYTIQCTKYKEKAVTALAQKPVES